MTNFEAGARRRVQDKPVSDMNFRAGIRAVAFASTLIACTLIASAVPLGAATEQAVPLGAATEQDVSQQIDNVGQQAMLTQRMTKAICFALLGVRKDGENLTAETAAHAFEDQLKGLIGEAQARAHADEAKALLAVAQISGGLTASVRQLAAGDLNSTAMSMVLLRNVPTLERMTAAADVMRAAHGAAALDGSQVATLVLANHQRMLSQKMVKDACLIALDMNAAASRLILIEKIEEFDATLRVLMRGDPARNVMKPTNQEVKAQLRLVRFLWKETKPLLQDAASQNVLTQDALDRLAASTDNILDQMNMVVALIAAPSG